MKLLNQALLYISIPIFLVVSIWAVIFYSNMRYEIHHSIDDGLDNYKLLIIQKSKIDSSILAKNNFEESNYAIREIGRPVAINIKDVYQDTLMYMFNEKEMEHVRMLTTAFQHEQKYYELKVINSMVEEDDQIANLFWSTLWLYFLLLSSITIIDNVVLTRLWKPFYKLVGQLKNFRIDKDSKLPKMESNTQEFLELKSATDSLIARTQAVYQNQKQFIENAAHELQTPLAIITNKLELLLEENRLADADAEIIGQVMQTTSRLIKLNKSLLFLSKIENKQFFDNQSLSLNQLVQQVAEELADFIDYKALTLTIEEREEVTIKMDAHLAYILVSNLIKNAIFYNIHKGQLHLIVESQQFSVRNTSQIGKLAESKIYKRFYKPTKQNKGIGLGLPIVKAICDLYGFKIAYQYEETHNFTVVFY